MQDVETTHRFEIWADNAFEALWAIDDLCSQAQQSAWVVTRHTAQGFIPKAILTRGRNRMELAGFGDYRSWDHIPEELAALLREGKVDVVLYDRSNERILFAIEDSSATMTGNQAQQRAERLCAFAEREIPIAYLMPAYARKNADGGVRTPNLWVPITALMAITAYRVPVLVFFFGTAEQPDNKRAGEGTERVSQVFWARLLGELGFPNESIPLIETQVDHLLQIVNERRDELFYGIPNWDPERMPQWSRVLAQCAAGQKADPTVPLPFDWRKKPAGLPQLASADTRYIDLPFAVGICEDLESGRAWYPVRGNSRGRPDSFDRIRKRIAVQKAAHESLGESVSSSWEDPTPWVLQQGKTASGRASPSVLSKGLVRYAQFGDLRRTLECRVPRTRGLLGDIDDNRPAILFVAANMVDVFLRDPYAGMLASYAVANGALDPRQRTVVVLWTPWQSPAVAYRVNRSGHLVIRENKSTRSWRKYADLTIFNGGAVVGRDQVLR